MVNIKQILYLTLLLIFSSESLMEKGIFDTDDIKTCSKYSEKIKNISPITANPCSSINSSLELKQNKCCRYTVDYDPLQEIKKFFLKM